ncbi:putative uncharacterized protein DDB_G0277255 [Octopus sinensis]|uniref:Uncharacterized protein n=1 Tax=Octopus sinensis TaxID=2607531 RepID=A0A7E6EKE9_9MOLL|nr:putative uncharacterized protein DDB_G0277255 [Octopus sinensis]
MEDLQRKIRELERCFNNEREQWKKLGWPVRQESPDTNPVNPVELARTAVSLPLALDNAPSPGSEGFSETSSNSFTTISVAQSTGSATLTGVAVSTVNTVSSCSSISSGSGGVGGGSSEITFATCSVSSSVDNPPPPPCPSSLPKNVSFSKDKDEDASIPTDSTGPRAMYTLPDDIQEVTLECVPHHYCTKNTRNSGTKENEGIIDNDDNDVDDDDSDCDSGSSENLASRRRNSMTIFDDYKANDSKSYEDDVVDGSPDIPSREPQQQQQQSQQQRQEPSDGNQKKVIIQLCCMEQLHNVDNIQLQRIFDKDMDAKLKDAFMKALTKHRNEELQRSNKLDQDETATECNDFADNRKFQRLWVRRASDEPKPKLSPLQRCREKVLKMENDRRQLTQKYEDKLRQQDRELQKLRNKFVEMSDTPKDYSVKVSKSLEYILNLL